MCDSCDCLARPSLGNVHRFRSMEVEGNIILILIAIFGFDEDVDFDIARLLRIHQ